MASVSPWSVAGGKTKRTFVTARLNCQRNGRQWDASRRSIRSSIKEYWNGLQSREAKVSFLSSIEQQKQDHEINQSADHLNV